MVSTLLADYPDNLTAIEYHVQHDGYDTPWGVDRLGNFYGASGGVIPVITYDGAEFWPAGDYEYGFSQRMQTPTDVTIQLSATEVQEREWDIHASVCVEPGGFSRTVRMYAVQVLNNYPSDPSYSRNTFQQEAPTEDVLLEVGSCTEFDSNFTFDQTSWNQRSDIKIIVWAQEPNDSWPAEVAQAAEMNWPFPAPPAPVGPEIPRGFAFGLPLFDTAQSAWTADAGGAETLASSGAQVQATYQALCGDTGGLYPLDDPPTSTSPLPVVNFDDSTCPIFEAGAGQQEVLLCDYDGVLKTPNDKWGVSGEGGPIQVPSNLGDVRPAGPEGLESDGHLILVDPSANTVYDFWQATTVANGDCQSLGAGLTGDSISQAGQADHFDLAGDGANERGTPSARPTGTPLLAGLILPEDVEAGEIAHALAVGIPGLRNLSPDPGDPRASDVVYPASSTDAVSYSVNPDALAAGQRLRLASTLLDELGQVIDEDSLAPITVMVIEALRTYGVYAVANVSGLGFFAEDSHTAVLDLSDAELNELIGQPADTPIPMDRSGWQLVMETLDVELGGIPFAYGSCSGASSTVTTPNFEVVEPADPPAAAYPTKPRSASGRRSP